MISLSYLFRVGHKTVSTIIRETCMAIWEELQPLYLRRPDTIEEYKSIADEYNKIWNFPHCVGAIDGKHVNIQVIHNVQLLRSILFIVIFLIKAPPNSGSAFHNYKGTFSFVLMGVCDARYRFIFIDVGAEGRNSDGGIFKNSNLGQRFENQTLNIPQPDEIFEGGPEIPYFMVGDEAFPLKEYLMRPYPGRSTGRLSEEINVFNYRLSRARRVIENAFGILVARWRIYRRPINTSLETAKLIVNATCCLHNFILTKEGGRKHKHGPKYNDNSLIDREVNREVVPGRYRQLTSTGRRCSKT
jgi:hypothetical protein